MLRNRVVNYLRLNNDNLGKVIEVLVPRMQHQVVLQDERGQPHVVGRNRCALFAKLAEHGCVVMRGLVVGKEDPHAFFQQKTPKDSFVVGRSTPLQRST